MTPDEVGKQLHDRATRGLPLSGEEQSLLAEWYARLNEEEGRQLSAPTPAPNVAVLRGLVDTTLTQIGAVSQKIQTILRENEALRNEIVILQQRITRKVS
jgi:hypothetical protein